MSVPESVKIATDEYFGNLDLVGRFIDECCNLSVEFETHVQDLYQCFRTFMIKSGEHPWTRNAFNEEIMRRGYKKRKIGSRGTIWFGIEIKPSLTRWTFSDHPINPFGKS